MAERANNEGFHVLDEFVCDAIREPGIPQADPKKQGKNERIRVIEELVFGGQSATKEDGKAAVPFPADMGRFRLPEAVAARLRSLLDRQDSGQPLTPEEARGGGRVGQPGRVAYYVTAAGRAMDLMTSDYQTASRVPKEEHCG